MPSPCPAPLTPCHSPHDDDDYDDDDDYHNDGDDSCHPQMVDCLEQTPCHLLHDAVQPAISNPQHSPPHLLSKIVNPPPLAEEVEVVTQPEVSSSSSTL